MSYRRCVLKRGSSAVLVLAFVIAAASCGGAASPTDTTTTFATATKGPVASGGTATGAGAAVGPSFGQILTSAKASEYKVTYKLTTVGAGEQSWYFKPPKTRYDFSSGVAGQTATVSIYSLPDGTFMCFGGTGQTAQCIGMSGLDTALQQNPAALYQQTMLQHPDQFSAVLVETRQIAGQQAQCFDVKSSVATAALTDGRFCYSPQGILLLQRFGAQGGPLDMEATSLSTTVPDSDFTLPSKPTIIGKP
jgi:hypothetical protein